MDASLNEAAGAHRALADLQTLAELFSWRVRSSPAAAAYRAVARPDATAWRSWRWDEIGAQVGRVSARLAALGLARGARVAILLPNGIEAVSVDQAVLACAAVPVPMHALDNPASIAYILVDSEAAVLVAASRRQWQAIVACAPGETFGALCQVVVLDDDAPAGAADGGAAVQAWEAWLAGPGAQLPPPPQAEDLAALVYTSGTTGKPKGVMLTHRNVLSNVCASLQRVAPVATDIFLSFLPLSHTFERTAGYYLPMAAGCCVAFSRSTRLLAEDLRIIRPTILVSVPRIYERVYAHIESTLAGAALRTLVFRAAQAVGWRRFCRRQRLPVEGLVPAALDALLWPLADRLVARILRAQFGGRLRLAVSGGAPLSAPVARCFLGLGLDIVQGYGMTETSPVVAVNTPEDNDPSTVGRALPGVEVRIGADRELQVRAPSVMRGYWKREADTARAFDDGWLRTGDQAAIENGRIRILGRLKEIIVTSTGEKIAPADLELAIGADPSFESAYAFGDDRPFIGCVLVLQAAYWKDLAARLGLDPANATSLEARAARDAVLARVRELTRAFPHYAQPRGVILSLEPWTVENTLMTPTLKLKRNNLCAHFGAAIEQMYGAARRGA